MVWLFKTSKREKIYKHNIYPTHFFLEKLFLASVDKIIVIDRTLEKFYKAFRNKVEVIYNPIDYRIFRPNISLRRSVRKQLRVKNKELLLLYMEIE
jgi:glycosyltransferase involved in cell wall biosynthesis